MKARAIPGLVILFSAVWAAQHLGAAMRESTQGLAGFQSFVNGEIPITHALVCRRVSNTNGEVLNQEWFRFGLQPGTWFVQRLRPDTANPSLLVPLTNSTIVGRSHEELWTVNTHNMHAAESAHAQGTTPEAFSRLERSLLWGAISLGVPRRLDIVDLQEALIEWRGASFTSLIATNPGEAKVSFAEVSGDAILNEDGRVLGLTHPPIGKLPGARVSYEYFRNAPEGIPSAFTVVTPARQYRYEFLLLETGTTNLVATSGYVPGMFADENPRREYTVWAKGLPYSVERTGLRPAFGVEQARRRATWLSVMVLVGMTFGAVFVVTMLHRFRIRQKRT